MPNTHTRLRVALGIASTLMFGCASDFDPTPGGTTTGDATTEDAHDGGEPETNNHGDVLETHDVASEDAGGSPPTARTGEHSMLVLDVSAARPGAAHRLQAAVDAAGIGTVLVVGDGPDDGHGWTHCYEDGCTEECATRSQPWSSVQVDIGTFDWVGEFTLGATLLPPLCGSATVDSVVAEWHAAHTQLWTEFYVVFGGAGIRSAFLAGFDDDEVGAPLCEDCGGLPVSVFRTPAVDACVRFGELSAERWPAADSEPGVAAVLIRADARPACRFPYD